MTVTFFSSHRRLELKSVPRENNSHPCAQRTLHPICVVFHACTLALRTCFGPCHTRFVSAAWTVLHLARSGTGDRGGDGRETEKCSLRVGVIWWVVVFFVSRADWLSTAPDDTCGIKVYSATSAAFFHRMHEAVLSLDKINLDVSYLFHYPSHAMKCGTNTKEQWNNRKVTAQLQ